jgi:iron complex outermembrane receptor protein
LQYLDNTSEKKRSLKPYYIQDLKLGYRFERFVFKEINLLFLVNNVFNKRYEPNGYTFSYQTGGILTTENYLYPMAGINFMAALNIRL